MVVITDLFIIGGGINGCGIARDAAGRGLSVTLAERGDLAQATSGTSTKLFHGGLRYLEFLEFRLVREALQERETLLRAMPHIARPMRFVLPLDPAMRFESSSPVSRMLARLLPWERGRRPSALIRAGLFIYDNLGGRQLLPGTTVLDLHRTPEGHPLHERLKRAYEYSDVQVDDARLVVLNARDAALHGAKILTRNGVISAQRGNGLWVITLKDGRTCRARVLINAGGPWVAEIAHQLAHIPTRESVRLVRGSHIVTPRLYDHDKAYFFQGPDGRIIFATPFHRDFTLIGTTDIDHHGPPEKASCTAEEQDYLCAFASRYFRKPVTRDQIIWSFAGVRSLYDDGATSATATTRDYVLSVDRQGPPCLSIFGGKITTYRRLAEHALKKLSHDLPDHRGPWTAGAPLPGGDFPVDGLPALIRALCSKFGLDEPHAERLALAYGTDALEIAAQPQGQDFGATLTEAELRWMIVHDFARTADDVLWRRSKLGLRMKPAQTDAVAEWMRVAVDSRALGQPQFGRKERGQA